MRLEYLADHPALLPQLARLHFDEWGYLRPDDTLEARTLRLRDCCGRAAIPTVVVALEDETLCGSAMLVAHELELRPDLTPWLDGVYVAAAYRGQGLGSALAERIVAEARSLGAPALYLYTSDAQSLYSRLGWVALERRQHRGIAVTVMSKRLGPVTLAESFRAEALRELQTQIDALRQSLSFAGAVALPEAQFRDIVISGREAQFTIFRQVDRPQAGQVLVTAQIARHTLGGVISLLMEKGLVISQDVPARDATDQELLSGK